MSGQCVRGVVVALAGLALPVGRAYGWGPDGHKTVAAIAEKLIEGTAAANQVRATLGASTSLQDAAVWADCAKGVEKQGNPPVFKYTGAGRYPECAPFETPDSEAEMVDFVSRNFDTCNPKPGEEACHKQYHYSDISIDHDHYADSFVGARVDDVEKAIAAAVAVLQGQAAPPPFSIKSKREALLLLVHYVGDIHQPLHVGAIYLDINGHPVHPDTSGFDVATDTRGGNQITVCAKNLHSTWDAIPVAMYADKIDKSWLTLAKGVPATKGATGQWSILWATDTQKKAQTAFKGVTFGLKVSNSWSAKLPSSYETAVNRLQKTQLTKGGARLAQLLKALWPDTALPSGSPR